MTKIKIVCMRSLYVKDTGLYGEKTSPLVVIDVVMCLSRGCDGEKKPNRWVYKLGKGLLRACLLEQIEILSSSDRCPSIVHSKLVINVFSVGSYGVQGYDEFVGYFRAVQVGSE